MNCNEGARVSERASQNEVMSQAVSFLVAGPLGCFCSSFRGGSFVSLEA
jgi:hypothetical protein